MLFTELLHTGDERLEQINLGDKRNKSMFSKPKS